MSEIDLGRAVRAWLLEGGWEVYQEVQIHRLGQVIDIVATRGESIVWAIECKKAANLDVLAQAEAWLGYANLVSVAVPRARATRGRVLFDRCARFLGMGALEVGGEGSVSMTTGRLWRTRGSNALKAALRPEHRFYAQAGSNRGGRWSPWKARADAISELVKRSPGMTVPELMDKLTAQGIAIDGGARAAVYSDLRRGWIRGVETRLVAPEGAGRRSLRLYPKHAAGGSICADCGSKLVLSRCPACPVKEPVR